jgi:hypothetical protein
MDMGALGRLRHVGGPVLELYEKLTAAADRSASPDSPDAMAKIAFERAWEQDPVATAQRAEEEAKEART